LELPAIGWQFPDKPILVEAPCLDCGESVRITMQNGIIESEEPRGLCFYVDMPVREWQANLPFA